MFFPRFFLPCLSLLLMISCTKEYSRENGNNTPAEGILWDSTGNCLPDAVYGTYYTGVTPSNDTAYVAIQVNVTKTGTYSIITEPKNGLTFFDSGYFTTTGINIIHLKPIGTPIIITTSSFNFSFDSTTCSFNVTVQDSTGTGVGSPPDTTGNTNNDSLGTWKFTETNLFNGNIDSTSLETSSGPEKSVAIFLRGHTKSGDTSFYISFILTNTLAAGNTYTAEADHLVFQFVSPATIEYFSSATPDATKSFALTITSYDVNRGIITCTFSGPTQTADLNIVTIADGSFSARLN